MFLKQKIAMKILIKLCFAFLLFFSPIWVLGQGLILDDANDESAPYLPFYAGVKGMTSVPASFSLRSYCPTPDDQGSSNSCVAFACGYGAYTILQARKNGWSSATATQNAYSAAYIFNQIGSQKGISFSNAFTFMANNGICRTAIFPNQYIFKGTLPSQTAIQEAQRNKIVPPPMPKIDADLNHIKSILAQGQPIILGAGVDNNFRSKSFANGVWSPQSPAESHAMVIVGYDDGSQTFDIMNSYGKQWGSGGFIKLKYSDLPKVFKLAYVLGNSGSRGEEILDREHNPFPPDSTQREVVGAFGLTNFIGKTADTEGSTFEQTKVWYNAEKQQYETRRRDWLKGAVFQFLASRIPPNHYLYIFSFDAEDKLNIHWPPDARWQETDKRTIANYAPNMGQKSISALILSPETQLTIPAPEEGLQVNTIGEDHLVVLIANQDIKDFKQRLDTFQYTEGGIQSRLQKGFGDVLIAQNRLVYLKDVMTVRRFTYESQGSIVPLVLSIVLEK